MYKITKKILYHYIMDALQNFERLLVADARVPGFLVPDVY